VDFAAWFHVVHISGGHWIVGWNVGAGSLETGMECGFGFVLCWRVHGSVVGAGKLECVSGRVGVSEFGDRPWTPTNAESTCAMHVVNKKMFRKSLPERERVYF
jgi:hypothetical protein